MTVALMAALVALAGSWMTRPLWRARLSDRQRRRAANVAAFRQRQAEIARDLEAGLLDAPTADALKTELEARLLHDAGEQDAPVAEGRRNFMLSALVTGFVAVAAGAGYFAAGSWQTEVQIASGAPPPRQGLPPNIDEMVAKLAAKMEQDPGDAKGWSMLGRSYFVLERYADAAKAYGKANELTGNQEPDLLVNEGEAMGLARDRDLVGRPQQLFEAALAIAPDHSKALWYAALAAQQAGDNAKALARFQELSKQELPPEIRQLLDERLVALGGTPATASVASPGMPGPPANPAGPANGAGTSNADGTSTSSGTTTPAPPAADVVLRVAITVKPDLAAKVPPDATLFVFAKAASGPPMPLAVYRGLASELPREVRLDDSMGMLPAMKLSMFDQWTVTARVTRSGQPQARSGDLQGSLTVGRAGLGDSALTLVVDQVVP